MTASAELCLSQLRHCGRIADGGPIAIDNFTVSFGEGLIDKPPPQAALTRHVKTERVQGNCIETHCIC
jgi:hypothetical protein